MSNALRIVEPALTPEAVWGPTSPPAVPAAPAAPKRGLVSRLLEGLSRLVSFGLLLGVGLLGCAFLAVWLPQRRGHVVMQEVFARGGDVTTTPCFDPGVRSLLGFSDIIGITLQNQSLEAGWCDRLGQLPQLKRLDLSGCRFPAADAQVLAELPRLKALLLARTSIGDDAIRAIPATVHLQELDLSSTRITAAAWPLIRRHPLTSLKLDDVAVDAKTAQEILSLPDLQGLSLSGSGLDDAAINQWPADSRLEWLCLSRTKIGDESLAWIGRQRRMKYLELADTSITDEGLSALANLRQLEWVDLSNTDITPAGLSNLHTASLTALDLSGTKLTDDSVKWLQQCRRLTWVDLRNTKVSESVIAELQGDLPNLRIEK